MLKSIAIMTSGGDSPGMNAAARAVARTALYEGVKVWGINDGYHGLLEENMRELESKDVGDIIQRGGTFLGTARCKRWQTPEGRRLGHEHLIQRGIEGLCVIGGDGSLRGAQLLSEEYGFPIVGLPGTIDNDVWGMDYTIGCDTAANTIIDAINKLRDTASAHCRVIVLEVMGRGSGWLALVSGISGGAEYIIVPEEEFNIEEIKRISQELMSTANAISSLSSPRARRAGRRSATTSPSIRTSRRASLYSGISSAAARRRSSTVYARVSSVSRRLSHSSRGCRVWCSATARGTSSRSTSTMP